MTPEHQRNEIIKLVILVIDLLVAKNYTELDALTHNRRLPAADLVSEFEENELHMVSPPSSAFTSVRFSESGSVEEPDAPDRGGRHVIEVTEFKDGGQTAWEVLTSIWTEEEGRSDFTLRLLFLDLGDGRIDVTLSDLYVM